MRRHTERRVPSVADELRRDTKPAHEEIAARAHQRYLDRGAIDGHDLEDWLAAERELTEDQRKFAGV